MSAVLRRAGDRVLTLGALLGLAALLGAALGAALGVRPFLFRSGSMAPTIDTGSLALARSVPARDLRAGDVVSVTTASGVRVTHRIVGTQPIDGRVRLTLRGDANHAVDPEQYTVESAYRVFWHVPRAGYAVAAISSPVGLLALGAAVMGLLVLGTGKAAGPPTGRRRARRAPRGRRARRAGATVLVATAVVAGPGQAGPASAAAWVDPVPVMGTTLIAGTVPASATFACGGVGVFSVTFTWTPVSGATSYTVHHGIGGALTTSTTSPTITFVAAIAGGTAWVEANHDYGSTTWTSVGSNTRTYTVAVASLCG